MRNSKHKVTAIQEPPRRQRQCLLHWFSNIGVVEFDIHVRRYDSTTFGQQPTKEHWITCHEKIDAKEVDKLWKWVRYENANGADIYFRPHRNSSHPVLFLDDLNLFKAREVANAYASAVVQTSKDNTQVWVKTARPMSTQERMDAQRYLSKKGYTDKGSVSGDHLGRMCGLRSQKNRCWVNAILFSTPHSYEPPQLKAAFALGGGGACASSTKGKNSPSEREFGWVLGLLRSGLPSEQVQRRLQEKAALRKKRNPVHYARLTVKKAMDVLRNLTEFDRV